MERPKESAILTKVHLGGKWQMFLNQEPDLYINNMPFVALTMMYQPLTREFVCRALGRLVKFGSVQSDQEFVSKSYKFFRNGKPCLGIKPPDANFPLSCQFSDNCSVMMSKSSKSKACPACLKELEDPLEIWQDHVDLAMDISRNQSWNTLQTSRNDNPRRPSQSIASNPLMTENYKEHIEKDPLLDGVDETDLGLPSVKLEPDLDQVGFNQAKAPPRITNLKNKVGPKNIVHFNLKYGPIDTDNSNKSDSLWEKTTCFECNSLVPMSSLTRHNMFRHQIGDFNCPLCTFKVQKAEQIIDHLKLHTVMVMKINCPNCQQDVILGSDGKDFMNHVAMCHKVKFSWDKESNQLVEFVGKVCMDCLGSFETEQELQEHEVANMCRSEPRKPTTIYACKKVNVKVEPQTGSDSEQSINLWSIDGDKSVSKAKTKRGRCYECKRVIPVTSMTQHKMFRHRIGNYQCPTCFKIFPNAKLVTAHLKLGPHVKKIKCPNCQQDVSLEPNYEGLTNHMDTCHKLKFRWDKESNQMVQFNGKKCMDCLRNFETEKELQSHEFTNLCCIKTRKPPVNYLHKKNNDNTFTCLKCNNTFSTLQNLRRHDERDHCEKILICDQCGMLFNNEINFQKHQNKHHPMSDALKCKECSFYAGDVSQLREHSAIHEEPKYLCTTCGKRFVKSCYLTIHLRSHTGEKPFKCDSCDFCTANAGNLATHKIRIHGKGARKKTHRRGTRTVDKT